ncbi:ATP-dependent helicase [[Clostridium] innocuum]|nr:ATP-dependent helicase [[Clostridium] innocuum]MCR0369763.1 ATP-dependent helicase [[Clostridium] innocuum]MCR0374726.1 ATP-dependent helicase [[Clostridium] innocuum]MCR0559716.1 ATP-dependent helicase [[Clostridium] innocuum]MCR0602590.1 ATP-dependent helicase [[Clostridium] innocuum]
MKTLFRTLKCPKRSFLEEKLISERKEDVFLYKNGMREVYDNLDLNEGIGFEDLSPLNDYLDTLKIGESIEFNKALICARVNRMCRSLTALGFTKIEGPSSYTETIIKDELVNKAVFDMTLIDSQGTAVLVKIKDSPLTISKSARKNENKPSGNLELYLLHRAVEKSGYKNFYVGFISLVAKKDIKEKKYDLNHIQETVLEQDKDIIIEDFYLNSEMDHNANELIEGLKKYDWRKGELPKCEGETECRICRFSSLCKHRNRENDSLAIKKEEAKTKGKNALSFTNQQKAYINDMQGNIRILAGAGSGKTTCTIQRVLQMIEHGCNPKDILMITFTEKGALSMKEKLSAVVKEHGYDFKSEDFDVYTFNSFGNKIISENYKELGFLKEPSLIDEVDEINILIDVLNQHPEIRFDNLNYEKPFLNMPKSKGIIYELKRLLVDFSEDKIKDVGLKKKLADFYAIYQQEKIKRNLISYNDQIDLVIELFSTCSNVVSRYVYRHILLDEFQDTSTKQMHIIDMICDSQKPYSLSVCGDDAQAIYKFRGVDMQNIIDFPKKYENTKDYFLLDNYRSTKEIVECANQLISLSSENIKKNMLGHKDGVCPYHYKLNKGHSKHDNLELITIQIAKHIKNRMRKGAKAADIAFIGRTRKELIMLQDELDKLNIPSNLAINEKLIENPYIKATKGLLAAMLDSDNLDEISLYIMTFKEGVEISKLAEECIYFKTMILEDIEYMSEKEKYSYFIKTLKEIKSDAINNFLDVLERKQMIDIKSVYEWIEMLFISNAGLSYNADDTPYDAVTLTTAHSSKGREWRYVYISMLELMPKSIKYHDGVFSYTEDYLKKMEKDKVSKDKIKELDEDIRLLFVAVTRAMDELYLYDIG